MTKSKDRKIQEQAVEIARLREALSCIEQTCEDEIIARFRNNSRSIEDVAKNSRVYHLLVMPRNIARNALEWRPSPEFGVERKAG